MTKFSVKFRHFLSCLTFIIWTVIFGYYYASGNFTDFLTPSFGWLVLLAANLSGCFALALIFQKKKDLVCDHHDHAHHHGDEHHHHHEPPLIRIFILFIPVLFILNFQSWQLGSYAFKKRAVGLIKTGGINNRASQPKEKASSVNQDGFSGTSPAAKPDEEISLIDIHMGFDKLLNSSIKTKGIYMEGAQELPEGTWVVFRFVMTCCVADAQPVAILVKGKLPEEAKADSWIEIEGKLKQIDVHGNPAAVIEAEKISMISAPANPYLLPPMPK
jgi:uncharacterized repeat protein (TIGR03943 family)